MKYWDELAREAMESPCLEVFKEGGGTYCHGLVDVVMFGHGLDPMISEIFSNRIESVIFVTINAQWLFGDRSPQPADPPRHLRAALPPTGPVTSPQVLPTSSPGEA